jgi:hypothetical protein
MVTLQELVPEQAVDQPAKLLPLDGVWLMVTTVPDAKLAEHVEGQEMPEGELVIVPEPMTATVRV